MNPSMRILSSQGVENSDITAEEVVDSERLEAEHIEAEEDAEGHAGRKKQGCQISAISM